MTVPENTQMHEPEPVAEEAPEETPEEPPEEIPQYAIDPARASQLNRSLALVLTDRRCDSCKARMEADRQTPSEQAHIKQITVCCSTQEGFIRPDMPMQEIVFRHILAEGNRPARLEHLHDMVTDRYYTPLNPRNISQEGLKRVLDSDAYYGFVRVPHAR